VIMNYQLAKSLVRERERDAMRAGRVEWRPTSRAAKRRRHLRRQARPAIAAIPESRAHTGSAISGVWPTAPPAPG
jgi:hypothetical protein